MEEWATIRINGKKTSYPVPLTKHEQEIIVQPVSPDSNLHVLFSIERGNYNRIVSAFLRFNLLSYSKSPLFDEINVYNNGRFIQSLDHSMLLLHPEIVEKNGSLITVDLSYSILTRISPSLLRRNVEIEVTNTAESMRGVLLVLRIEKRSSPPPFPVYLPFIDIFRQRTLVHNEKEVKISILYDVPLAMFSLIVYRVGDTTQPVRTEGWLVILNSVTMGPQVLSNGNGVFHFLAKPNLGVTLRTGLGDKERVDEIDVVLSIPSESVETQHIVDCVSYSYDALYINRGKFREEIRMPCLLA